MALTPLSAYRLLNPAAAAPKSAAPYVAPNAGYGMLNPGTTLPGAAPPSVAGDTSTAGGSGGSGSGGNNTAPGVVDYTTLLANDPFLSQTLRGNQAQGVQNLAQLNAQRQRALIGFGKVPAVSDAAVGDLSGAIDPTTQALANQNTQAGTSTVAQLLRAYQQKQEADTANLAARGILRSGAYNQHSTENLGGYNTAQSQATGQLLDYLTGLYQGYLQQQQALTGAGTQATSDALARLIAEIQAGLVGGGGGDSGTGGGGGGGSAGGGSSGGGGGATTTSTPTYVPPNTGYGMLNPGTTIPGSKAAPVQEAYTPPRRGSVGRRVAA